MIIIVYGAVAVATFIFFITSALPTLIGWIFFKKFKVEVSVSSISLWPLSLRNIKLVSGSYKIVIDCIGITSGFKTKHNHNKLVALYFNEIRVEKSKEWVMQKDVDNQLPEPFDTDARSINRKLTNFLTIIAQVVAVQVTNLSVIFLHDVPDCFLNFTLQEFFFQCSSDKDGLILTGNLSNGVGKLLHRITDFTIAEQHTIIEFTVSQNLRVVLRNGNRNTFSLQSMSCDMALDIVVGALEPLVHLYKIYRIKRNISLQRKLDNSRLLPHNSLLYSLYKKSSINLKKSNVRFLPDCQCLDFLTLDVGSIELALSGGGHQSEGRVGFKTELRIDEALLGGGSSESALVKIDRITFISVITDESVMCEGILHSFATNYNHAYIQPIVMACRKQFTSWESNGGDGQLPRKESKLQRLLSGKFGTRNLKLSLEVRQLCSVFIFPGCSTLGMGFALNRVTHQKECDQLDWEFLLESFWLRLGDSSAAETLCINKKNHYWNTPLAMGLLLIKHKERLPDSRTQCMVDDLRAEWRTSIAELYTKILELLPVSPDRELEVSKEPNAPRFLDRFTLQFRLAGFNFFAVINERVFVTRLDTCNVNITNAPRAISCCVENVKIVNAASGASSYPCVRTTEMGDDQLIFSTFTLKFNHDRGADHTAVHVLDNTKLLWNTTVHMSCVLLVEEISGCVRTLKGLLRRPSFETGNEAVADMPATERPSFSVRVKGRLRLEAHLSDKHDCAFTLSEVGCALGSQSISHRFAAEFLTIEFDGKEIYIFEDVELSKVALCEAHGQTRKLFGENVEQLNNVWNVHIHEVRITHPFGFNYAEAANEEFLNIQKWLKKTHHLARSRIDSRSALSADVVIRIHQLTWEICDDPLEVKLRDNYELLVDEFHENKKRADMLEEKMEERRSQFLIPSARVEELYANLRRKATDIYVKRSKQLYHSSPMRTQLGLARIQNMEITVIADRSIHGQELVIEQMKLLDPDSPFPEEEINFVTLWARFVKLSMDSFTVTLRDYPCPLFDAKDYHVWGRLVGAEQEAWKRGKRVQVVQVGEPWGPSTVERNMCPLKFYYDLSCDVEEITYGYGPCWEPVMAQLNLSMDMINRASVDPSPPLPFWDKMRLLYHGHFTMSCQQLTVVMHASHDPYNITELMEFTWKEVVFDWTNAKFITKGDFSVNVRTASKYDDCQLIYIPNLKFVVKLDWQCVADPCNHHSVMPCAPDKLPEYSSNQEHDSYRAFRSVSLNASLSLDAKMNENGSVPSVLCYSSTLRWMDNLKGLLAGVSRPIKRGPLFSNVKPRKTPLMRHCKLIRLSIAFHRMEARYWMSFAQQCGVEVTSGKLGFSSEYYLNIVPVEDGLKHRPKSEWNVAYMNCEVCNLEIWLQGATAGETIADMNVSLRLPVEKRYFLSLTRLSYGREASFTRQSDMLEPEVEPPPTHRLIVQDLRAAWTVHNRNVVFGMFDGYVKNKLLRRNLSTEALKGFKMDSATATPMKRNLSVTSHSYPLTSPPASSTPQSAGRPSVSSASNVTQPLSAAISMLQKLVAEADSNSVVFSEEVSPGGVITREDTLHGVSACQTNDVLHKHWLVELINSQVLLKGTVDSLGYVLMSSAKAQILQRVHNPVWKNNRTLCSKTTWVGSLECMQYYATVDPGPERSFDTDNIQWLGVEDIEGRDSMVVDFMPDLVGSGHSVGGVVSNIVGGGVGSSAIQLQRIVSRCGCHFFYASYGEDVGPTEIETMPVPPATDEDSMSADPSDTVWEDKKSAVDSFTLTHHDLQISTNSLQYAMLLDIINNLLLPRAEPRKKEALEKLQRMRFQIQLSSVEQQREPILHLQNQLRTLMERLRRLEKDAYNHQRLIDEHPYNENELLLDLSELEQKIYECKISVNALSDELAMLISCFKESQLVLPHQHERQPPTSGRNSLLATETAVARRSEMSFKHAQWRLTEADGQIGISDIVLDNFVYSKINRTDDSGEHLMELGNMKVCNLLQNEPYKDVLQPMEIHGNIPLERRCSLRVFAKEKTPVGGISIKEHLEINVVPLKLEITFKFYKTMLKFFFAERSREVDNHGDDTDSLDQSIALSSSTSASTTSSMKSQHPAKKRPSTLPKKGQQQPADKQDDIEKMRERAEKNKMFLYIKIPEVHVRLSYKGEKEKNIEDVRDFHLVVPTLEYHNVTWTWLDLLLAMKTDCKSTLVHQAIKQKFHLIPRSFMSTAEESNPLEEDKARMLLGALPGDDKKKRSGLGKK